MRKLLSVLCFLLAFSLLLSPLCIAAEGNADAGESGVLPADAYLYSIQNGMPKYWLDLSGDDTDTAVLHCWFRSSDPTFYHSFYLLDLKSANIQDDSIAIRKVTDMYGFDRSDCFRRLRFQLEGEMLIMDVERDEKTLAGGSEDNILTGHYLMEPMAVVHLDFPEMSAEQKSSPKLLLRPLKSPPYTARELGRLAQVYYFIQSGFYPPLAETVENADGSFTIHLYETVNTDGVVHTATSAWYTVDAYGIGTDELFGDAVCLVPEAQ